MLQETNTGEGGGVVYVQKRPGGCPKKCIEE